LGSGHGHRLGAAQLELVPEDRLVDELDADLALADPADDAAGAVVVGELELDRLADPRLDLRVDHRAARGDVDHRHDMLAPPEPQQSLADDAAVAVLGALVGGPGLATGNGDPGQAAGKAHPSVLLCRAHAPASSFVQSRSPYA